MFFKMTLGSGFDWICEGGYKIIIYGFKQTVFMKVSISRKSQIL